MESKPVFSEIVFGPADAWLAAGDESGGMYSCSSQSGDLHRATVGHRRYITALAAATENSEIVVSGAMDGTVRTWRMPELSLLAERSIDATYMIESIALNFNATRAFCSAYSNDARKVKILAFDVQHGTRPATVLATEDANLRGPVNLTSDGRNLICSIAERVHIWDARSLSLIRHVDIGKIQIHALSPRQQWQGVATDSGGSGLSIWDLESGACSKRLRTNECDGIAGIRFSPDGLRVVFGLHYDKRLREFEVGTGKDLRTYGPIEGPSVAVCYSANGSTLVSADKVGGMSWWSTETGRRTNFVQRTAPDENET